ncbi:hypothetical protein BDP81DRAFT_79737 [Colletotrichum phormii]|uniref:Uncharacterized protein n=1 Tax=Colletotrichum phormii TaxID=359342 RepID=A0AAJ0EM95_9PEZI|nr:uncharacterized protein BDP81DRAFT_79737 [Colletotrichum phormii]KAK1654228.1 hypothetical protein BDP81DRAFT_79737 [Colletotrichum phormii]
MWTTVALANFMRSRALGAEAGEQRLGSRPKPCSWVRRDHVTLLSAPILHCNYFACWGFVGNRQYSVLRTFCPRTRPLFVTRARRGRAKGSEKCRGFSVMARGGHFGCQPDKTEWERSTLSRSCKTLPRSQCGLNRRRLWRMSSWIWWSTS